MSNLPLDVLLRELRARAHEGDEQTVVLYGRPLPEHAGVSTAEMIADVRRLQGALYAVDSRRDLHQVKDDPAVLRAAAAVAMLVEAVRLRADPDGWALETATFGARYRLHRSERFHDQPCAGFCSGVLVRPRILATAAHCVRGIDDASLVRRLEQIRVVFGFQLRDAGNPLATSKLEVYRPVRLIARRLDDASGEDWALLELDRPVEHVEPMALREAGRIADGAEVSVLGHPCGLPAKYAPGARVRANGEAAFFRADVDAFGGNSGSPVFGADWTVEGLLVRGEPDFARDPDGDRALVIPVIDGEQDPPGEDCARATLLAAALATV